jgi:hypothetical protein
MHLACVARSLRTSLTLSATVRLDLNALDEKSIRHVKIILHPPRCLSCTIYTSSVMYKYQTLIEAWDAMQQLCVGTYRSTEDWLLLRGNMLCLVSAMERDGMCTRRESWGGIGGRDVAR